MMKPKALHITLIALVAMLVGALQAPAKTLNDKIQNRPYTDQRPWHLGFSVGFQTLDMRFTHTGFVTDQGQTWFLEQPDFSPGFCVNGLFSLRLNDYFSVRANPGIYFGNRVIRMYDTTNGDSHRQDLKSAYLVVPVDLKVSAQRYRNVRPYFIGGVMPAIDVAKKKSDFVKTKPFEVFLEVGFGCDFYLPFFKLNPEIKFCFGLTDIIQRNRPDLADDPTTYDITRSIGSATSQMVVLTFYFE